MPTTLTPDLHLYLDIPTVVFRARVNMASITYPVTALTFDTVTLGAYTDIAADMTLVLGSAVGLDDLGRVRVQNVATISTIPIGRVSQGTEDGTLNISDNAYIEVWDDFRVWAKIPYDAPDGVDYKDSDIQVGDYNEDIPPVANCGPGTIGYVDSVTGLFTVQFPMDGINESYAMADGATISTYNWDVKDGTITVGTAASSVITATFPIGKRWVGLTITDSNGKQHSARCRVVALDPDHDVSIRNFQVESHRIEMRGQTISFRLLDDTPRTTYPDGCLVMFWDGVMLNPGDRSNLKFYGWHQNDSFAIRATPTGLIRDTILNCVDVAGRLAVLPSFPQALQREPEEDEEGNPIDIMWALMTTLTMRKCLHYLIFWHSTALGVADLLLSDDLEDYPAMSLYSTGSNLYDQINSQANRTKPDYYLTCDIQGVMAILPDWMLLDFDDRPVSTAGTFTEDYWSDIHVDYNRWPRVYNLRSGAIVCSTDWIMLGGEPTLPLAFCDAPGVAFGQGTSPETRSEGLTQSQAQLNACEGHRYARLNARYGLFSIVEPSGNIQDFQPAHMLPVQVNISAATAAQRGLDFTTARGLVKAIDMRYNHTDHGTWISPTVQWEREVTGLPAVTHTPEVPEDPDYETPPPPLVTIPPDMGLISGQQQVAGIGLDGYIYRTSDFQTASGSGGPTWTRVDTTIPDTIYSFVVDPFSPGYVDGAGAINGWIANDTDIYRVTDLFGTVTATSVVTFGTEAVAASYHWRTIQASFGAFFAEGANPWLMCVSYYGSTGGHTGTWVTYSTDGGVTWSTETQISAHYNTTAAVRFNPVGLYLSPKTPGLAYTVAYTSTIADAEAVGYVSTNWGATWTAYSAIDAGQGNAGSIHLPWPDNDLENVIYHGELIAVVNPGTDTSLLPFFGKLYTDNSVSNSYTALGSSVNVTVANLSTDTGGGSHTLDNVSTNVIIAPPANTKRMEVHVDWNASNTLQGAFSTQTSDMTVSDGTGTNRTGNDNYTGPANNGSSSGSYDLEWTFPAYASSDWPINRDTIQSSPPTSPVGCRVRAVCVTNAVGGGNVVTTTITMTITVTEIELDDGTTYTPTPASGARSFRLKRVTSGTPVDISAVASTINYGVNDYGFTIRAYDSDRQYMALAGIGNDTSGTVADDKVGLWVSTNAGSTWTNILAPVAATNAVRGLQIAFSGNSSSVLFAWGGLSSGSVAAIYYSSNFGTTLDSREGNLESSFGGVTFIGIAGGTS